MRVAAITLTAAAALALAAPNCWGGPFTDVPRNHWSYQAVNRAANAGIVEGYNHRFHGNRPLTRYQMAMIVSRMLAYYDKVGPGKVSRKEIEELSALTAEFADELALLNIKVSSLEDGMAALRKDVSNMKKSYAGPKAGLSALVQTRLVTTDDGNAGLAAPSTFPQVRYVGGTNAAGTRGEGRTEFNISQVSMAWDRRFDEKYYAHVQMDVDADNDGNFFARPVGGINPGIQINEAYVDVEWLFEHDLRLRAGTWALPFDRERNPHYHEYPYQDDFGFRSLDLTVSPSLQGANWELARPVGVALWNGKDAPFQWHIGVHNSTTPARFWDGTLLAWRNRGGGGAITDAPVGTQINDNAPALGQDQANFGFYGWVGDQYAGGFAWDAGFFSSGGDINPGTNGLGTPSSWSGIQFNANYWWNDWGLMVSGYSATSDSLLTGGAYRGAAATFNALGLIPGPAAANARTFAKDADSTSLAALINYQVNHKNSLTIRYESAEDKIRQASIEGTIVTVGWNHRISAGSLLQLEFITPDTETTAVNAAGVVTRNKVDANDDQLMVNYKATF